MNLNGCWKKSVGRLPIIKLVWLQFDLLQDQLNAKRELVCYHHLREDPVPKIGKWASSIPRWVESRGGAGEAGPGGRLPHVGARPLAGPHPPHIPGCPPPPAFPPPTATKASPHTQVSLLLNLDRGKVGGELHHHSGVPTGLVWYLPEYWDSFESTWRLWLMLQKRVWYFGFTTPL